MVFLSLAGAAGQAIDTSLNAPDFGGFHRRILAGEVTASYSTGWFTENRFNRTCERRDFKTPCRSSRTIVLSVGRVTLEQEPGSPGARLPEPSSSYLPTTLQKNLGTIKENTRPL
jgi:hypothetical protein